MREIVSQNAVVCDNGKTAMQLINEQLPKAQELFFNELDKSNLNMVEGTDVEKEGDENAAYYDYSTKILGLDTQQQTDARFLVTVTGYNGAYFQLENNMFYEKPIENPKEGGAFVEWTSVINKYKVDTKTCTLKEITK